MKRARRGLIVGLVLACCAISSGEALAAITARDERFTNRVCRAANKMTRRAAPALLKFNDAYYYVEEHTPENLREAGRYFARVVQVWRNYNRRYLRFRPPPDLARAWRHYGRQEWAILRVNRLMVTALKAADDARFERLERKNERLQIKRNSTQIRLGLFCG